MKRTARRLKISELLFNATNRRLARHMFAARHYRTTASLPEFCGYGGAFLHFLMAGVFRGVAPGPLVSPSLQSDADMRSAEVPFAPRLAAWLEDPASTPLANDRFDPAFYVSAYPDVTMHGLDPFVHFLASGQWEGRRPNAVFDPAWHAECLGNPAFDNRLSPYQDYLTNYPGPSAAPCRPMLAIMEQSTDIADFDRIQATLKASSLAWVSHPEFALLAAMFVPDAYRGRTSATTSPVDTFCHFLSEGAANDVPPGPLFDPEFYRSRIAAIGTTPPPAAGQALAHFLRFGIEHRVVPTTLFDEECYALNAPEIAAEGIWGFAHFALHGIYEGRDLDGGMPEAGAGLHSPGSQLHNWRSFWQSMGIGMKELTIQPSALDEPNEAPNPKGTTTVPPPSNAEVAALRDLFDLDSYLRAAELSSETPHDEAFRHFIDVGLASNISPSCLFDVATAYRVTRADRAIPAALAWVRLSKSTRGKSPTIRFDPAFYLKAYPEVAKAGADPYWHFLRHGLKEGRKPNAAFDPQWYAMAYPHATTGRQPLAYIDFVLNGLAAGYAPSRFLLPVLDNRAAPSPDAVADFDRLLTALARWSASLSPARLELLLALFVPEAYAAPGVSASATPVDKFEHFLCEGLSSGQSPGPLFDPEDYSRQAAVARLKALWGVPPLLHFLRSGVAQRKVPNRIFDERLYVAANADLQQAGAWGFRHFITHGIYEGRVIANRPTIAVWSGGEDLAAKQLASWQRFWRQHLSSSDGSPQDDGAPWIAAMQRQLDARLAAPLMHDIMKRANLHDPSIGNVAGRSAAYAAPAHDVMHDMFSRALGRLPRARYDTIVCVPWLRAGGADLVACQIADAMRKIRPDESVLFLRTDQPHLERPDWLPDGIDNVCLSDIVQTGSTQQAELLLYALFKALTPRRVINVNSLTTWRTFARFGQRLAPQLHLYSYLFCWDQLPDGTRVGYPSMFFASTLAHHAAIFTDTQYLRNELLTLYKPPREMAKRVAPLYTPTRSAVSGHAAAEALIGVKGRRPRVIWAGRLDRQKRFDLVQQIATAMPDVEFLCWGEPLLDAAPDHRLTPANLKLMGAFKTYDELPFHQSDLWLFTSAWEGMPTILIEIAIKGMAVVGSMVGGVPELLDETTAFPVHDVESPAAYVAAIRQALGDPDARIARSAALQQRAAARHSDAHYLQCLTEIFDAEDAR